MRRATPETLYSYTSARNPVTLTVEPGEVFEVETVPTCGAQFDSRTGKHHPEAPGAINASTGAIAVAGARPGQVLGVEILDIRLDEFGYTRVGKRSILLPHLTAEEGWEEAFKVVPIRDGFVEWSEKLRIPASPMVGYLGVARPEEVQSNAHNGLFGGNFDVPEITSGAKVLLPVLVEGALLHVGDVHALQGDGEIDGAGGIETGALITLRVELRERPARFRCPRIETADFIAVAGFARPAEAAFKLALEDLLFWMVEEFAFTLTGAHMLLAQVLEARVTQFVNPLFTCLCKVRRGFLAA